MAKFALTMKQILGYFLGFAIFIAGIPALMWCIRLERLHREHCSLYEYKGRSFPHDGQSLFMGIVNFGNRL